MDESLNLEELRAQARAQLAGRMPPRTAWITGFEAALRQLLSPRAELFLAIMAAADNPGLDDERGGGTGNESGHPRGWIIGNLRTHVQDEWGTVREVRAKFLTLGPDCIGFQTADAGPDPFAASTAITRFAPRESAVEGGELREQSALAQVAVNLIDYGAMAEGTPEEAAAAYAAACDHRMLALLCAQELTFPDRDLREAVWDEHDSVMISRAEEARALARASADDGCRIRPVAGRNPGRPRPRTPLCNRNGLRAGPRAGGPPARASPSQGLAQAACRRRGEGLAGRP